MAEYDLDSLAKPAGGGQTYDLDSLATSPEPLVTQDGRFRVIDGDTVEEVESGERIRLSGVDASEKGRTFSNKAKKDLKELLDQGGTKIERQGKDHSGKRTVANLYTADGTSINSELVRRGVAPDTYKGGDPDLRREGRAASLRFMGMGTPDEHTVEAQLEALATPLEFTGQRAPRRRKLTYGQEFGEGVRRGTDSLQAAGYGAVALAGSALGSDTIKDWGMEGYRKNLEEAGQHAPSVSFKEMEIGEDFWQWAAGAFGEAMPSMGTMVFGGGVGAQAGKAVVKRMMERKVKKEAKDMLDDLGFAGTKPTSWYVEKALANELTHKKMYRAAMGGAGVGGFAMSAGPQAGDIFAEIYDEAGVEAPGTAAIAGGLGGLLDTAAMGAVVRRLFPGMPKKAVKSLILETAKVSGKQTLIEGTTEGAQEFIANVARSTQDPNFDPLSEEAMDEVYAAAATGALVGAVTGGVSGPFTAKKAKEKDDADTGDNGVAPPDQPVDDATQAAPEQEEAAPEPEPEAPPAEDATSGLVKKYGEALTKTLNGLIPNQEKTMEALAAAAMANPETDPLDNDTAMALVKAQERGLTPEDVPNSVTVETDATIDGQSVRVQIPARRALKALDTEIALYERLKRCMSS